MDKDSSTGKVPKKGKPPNDKSEVLLARTFAARMKSARELCGMSQVFAAEQLGYANSSQLSKVEGAENVSIVPLWLVRRAAEVYSVSSDYLLGLSDDWEGGPLISTGREVASWFVMTFQRHQRAEVRAINTLVLRVEKLSQMVAQQADALGAVDSAFSRVRELNPNFDSDVRAGGTLAGAVERAALAGITAKASLSKFRTECKVAMAGPESLQQQIPF